MIVKPLELSDKVVNTGLRTEWIPVFFNFNRMGLNIVNVTFMDFVDNRWLKSMKEAMATCNTF